MKTNYFLLLATVILTACSGEKQTEHLMTVDLGKDYPEKELTLQDFMEVEYIPLETTEEFVTYANLKAVGEKLFVLSSDGKLVLFNRYTGKGIRVIEHQGQGAEEYTFPSYIVLDEKNGELFVNDTGIRKILVYDLEGNFQRSFSHPGEYHITSLQAFDGDYLLGHDEHMFYKDLNNLQAIDLEQASFFLISKQDGSIVKEIKMPMGKVNVPMVNVGGIVSVTVIPTVMPLQDDMLIIENSADTIYRFTAKGHQLEPFMAKKTSTDPERLVTIGTVTPQYCFFQIIDKTLDTKTGRGFPHLDLVYDRQTNKVFKVTVLNADFTTRETVNMIRNAQNGSIACIQTLQAHKLIEANEKNELTGKLKEIASKLDEDSNPVLMIMKERGV